MTFNVGKWVRKNLDCPFCGSAPGEVCKSGTSNSTSLHRERFAPAHELIKAAYADPKMVTSFKKPAPWQGTQRTGKLMAADQASSMIYPESADEDHQST